MPSHAPDCHRKGFRLPWPVCTYPRPWPNSAIVVYRIDAGPFWMTPNDCILSRLDQVDGDPSIVQRNKSELILELHCQGINYKGKNKKELVAIRINKNIPMINHEVHKIKGDWYIV